MKKMYMVDTEEYNAICCTEWDEVYLNRKNIAEDDQNVLEEEVALLRDGCDWYVFSWCREYPKMRLPEALAFLKRWGYEL